MSVIIDQQKLNQYARIFGGTLVLIANSKGVVISIEKLKSAMDFLDIVVNSNFFVGFIDHARYIEIIRWLNSKPLNMLFNVNPHTPTGMYEYISRYGTAAMFEIFFKICPLVDTYWSKLFTLACIHNNLSAAMYIHEKQPDHSNDIQYIFEQVCMSGYVEMASWLLQFNPIITKDLFVAVCSGKNIQIVELIYHNWSGKQSIRHIDDVIYGILSKYNMLDNPSVFKMLFNIIGNRISDEERNDLFVSIFVSYAAIESELYKIVYNITINQRSIEVAFYKTIEWIYVKKFKEETYYNGMVTLNWLISHGFIITEKFINKLVSPSDYSIVYDVLFNTELSRVDLLLALINVRTDVFVKLCTMYEISDEELSEVLEVAYENENTRYIASRLY